MKTLQKDTFPYEFSLTKSSSIEMVRILFNGFMFSLIGMTEWSQQTHKSEHTYLAIYLFIYLSIFFFQQWNSCK